MVARRRGQAGRPQDREGLRDPDVEDARIEDVPHPEPVRAGPQLHGRSRHPQGLDAASTPRTTPQHGPDVFRFKLDVAKGKTGSQEIVEERVHAEKGTLLKSIPEAKLREYLAHAAPSADVKAALTKALALPASWSRRQAAAPSWRRTSRSSATTRPGCARTCKIIPPTSEPYKQFLEKFVAQETEIEGLQKNCAKPRRRCKRPSASMTRSSQPERGVMMTGDRVKGKQDDGKSLGDSATLPPRLDAHESLRHRDADCHDNEAGEHVDDEMPAGGHG